MSSGTLTEPGLTLARPAVAGRYLAIWAVALLGSWAIFTGLTIAVNPYGLFGTTRIKGFNEHIYEMASFGRVAKLRAVEGLRPRAIIIGDSQAEGGLRTRTLTRLTGETAYNMGRLAAPIDEIELVFRHALQMGSIRTAVLALDYVSFEEGSWRTPLMRERTERQFLRTVRDFAELTMSMQALIAAIQNVAFNRIGRSPSHNASGDWTGHQSRPIDDNAPIGDFKEPAESAYRAFEAICAGAVKNKVDLRIFATPIHRTYGVAPDDYKAWLTRVQSIARKHGLTVADEGTNQAFNADKANFFDRLHFTPEVGDAILSRLFAGAAAQNEKLAP